MNMKAKDYLQKKIDANYDIVHFSDGEHDKYLEMDEFIQNYGNELVDQIGKFINIRGCIFSTEYSRNID